MREDDLVAVRKGAQQMGCLAVVERVKAAAQGLAIKSDADRLASFWR